jgi:phosphoglycerate dehydrogenase-like enzyme
MKLYPDVKFNDEGVSLSGESLINFLAGYEKAIVALETIDKSILSKLPDLAVIGKYGVGLDMIDLRAMHECGVKLGWTGGVNKRSVSELVVSFAIYLLHRVPFANSEVKKGEWYQVKGRQLTGRTFGIVGCGHIGKDLVKLLAPYDCTVLVNDILDYSDFYTENNVTGVSLDTLIRRSDVVSLHLPLNSSTRNIINEDYIKRLKKDSVFINIARGGLIDEDALTRALLAGNISGAALDVFAVEPPIDSNIAHLENVIVTPHIGGSTEEAVYAMGMAALNGLDNSYDALTFLND